MLYRDVLQVAFRFLPLAALASVVAVSHRWSEAAAHMSGIGGSAQPRSVQHRAAILDSRLVHHVAALTEPEPMSADYLSQLADRASSLISLQCALKLSASPSLVRFPPRLRSLTLTLPLVDSVVVPCAVEGLAALPHLRRLHLKAGQSLSDVSLDFLRRLPQLEDLSLSHAYGSPLDLQSAHMDVLRHLPALTLVDLRVNMSEELVRHLVRPALPPSLRGWKTLSSSTFAVDRLAVYLQRLPSLTQLRAWRFDSIFVLSSWPQLTLLYLDLAICTSTTAEIVAALQRCTLLTRLEIDDGQLLSNEELAAVLPVLPALRSLRLGWMRQLTGLSSLALVPHLTDLELTYCRHPSLLSSELRHLHGLVQLTSLYINETCVRTAGDEADVALLQPPSSVLPKLNTFRFYPSSRPTREAGK